MLELYERFVSSKGELSRELVDLPDFWGIIDRASRTKNKITKKLDIVGYVDSQSEGPVRSDYPEKFHDHKLPSFIGKFI